MSTYGEILANVLLIVPNPEKETLIRAKLNQMLRFISASGLYWRDIEETTIAEVDGVDAAAYIQSITITTAIRQLIYVKYPSTVEGSIACVNVESLIDNCEILGDVAYLSGTSLHIKNSKLTSEFNLGYYTHPDNFAADGSDDDLDNWITDLAPGLVEDLTAAYMLNLIGEKEDAKRIMDLATTLKGTYIRDFVVSVQ